MKNATRIQQQGFDERMAQRKLYGPGVYFTTAACKAAKCCQHGQNGVILICRVLLGHPFQATGPMPNHGRPPMVDGHDVPHDSVVARPRIPNGQRAGQGRQTHWEFVVSHGDLQVFPEYILHFTCPSR